MVEINLWIITTSLGVGAILLYIQANVFSLFLKSYKVTKSPQLKNVTYAFILFMVSTLSMMSINIYLSIFASEFSTKELLFYREFSTTIYNIIFALGLFFLIISSTKSATETILYTPLFLILETSYSHVTLENNILTLFSAYGRIATDTIIIVEASFLLALYLTYSEKEVIMGKLWTIGIILIMFSRAIDLLPMKPYSEMFMVFMDMVAFTLLYLMKKEAEIFTREGR